MLGTSASGTWERSAAFVPLKVVRVKRSTSICVGRIEKILQVETLELSFLLLLLFVSLVSLKHHEGTRLNKRFAFLNVCVGISEFVPSSTTK